MKISLRLLGLPIAVVAVALLPATALGQGAPDRPKSATPAPAGKKAPAAAPTAKPGTDKAAGDAAAPAPPAKDATAPTKDDPGAATAPAKAPDAAAPKSPEAAKSADGYPIEEVCNDRKDNDNDSLIDCADHDCEKAPNCKPGQGEENSNARCSDWVDNDGDGNIDCDDANCEGPGITACKGSWVGPLEGTGTRSKGPAGGTDEVPELGEGQSVEDLIGKGGDADGERNNVLCADGIDNDRDGKVDCADFGCRFDPAVTVCRGNPGMRFSVVAAGAQQYYMESYRPQYDETMETRISRVQLRSFGPIPLIDNSFFLISTRWEKTPRLTFAMFQVPIGSGGHTININSGGGGLSLGPIVGFGKHMLDDQAYYAVSAFQGGNGAAVELQGPVGDGVGFYRAYIAGGGGRFTGNVGGRYFTYDNTSYTYSVGGLFQWNVMGNYSQWDRMRLYVPAPATLALLFGAKYDQRASETFPAGHFEGVLRAGRFVARAEAYMKWATAKTRHKSDDVEFTYAPWAWNLQAGYLIIKKRLMIAADYGVFTAEMGDVKIGDKSVTINKGDLKDSDLRKQLNEDMFRAAAHIFVKRNIGVLTLVYRQRRLEKVDADGWNVERSVKLEGQYRF